jgi:hypothetical protein
LGRDSGPIEQGRTKGWHAREEEVMSKGKRLDGARIAFVREHLPIFLRSSSEKKDGNVNIDMSEHTQVQNSKILENGNAKFKLIG